MSVIGFIVFVILVGLVLSLIYSILDTLCGSNEERIVKIPQEITKALEEARKATKSCQEMCGAAAFVEGLQSNMQSVFPSSNLNFTGGQGDNTLRLKNKKKSVRALKKCFDLSVEGVGLTAKAHFLIMTGLFQSAEYACRKCECRAGLDVCPAMSFLEKIELQ